RSRLCPATGSRAGRAGRRSRVRNLRARAAEDEAERLLAREGYALIERQAAAALLIEVDGEPREVGCRADLLVERDGRLYVADVKSGALATDPTLPATRRQLLEYLLAYEVDGALLVDMEARQIREVVFPALTPPR
ncbi:MAG TPA: PD-(D/E)XK nuclease family protein, partial [Myxococcota bacterium]|nr:PD-(D/E)XK nuclease family protein [Myxococcota bacterium]